MKQTGLATGRLGFLNRSLRTCAASASHEAGAASVMRWDDSASWSPRATSSLSQGTRSRSEEAGTRGGLSGDPGKEGQHVVPSTGDPVTWARRMKMRSTPDPAPPERQCLGGTEGAGM